MRHALVLLLLLGCSGPAKPAADPAKPAADPGPAPAAAAPNAAGPTEPAPPATAEPAPPRQPPGDLPAPESTSAPAQPKSQAEIAAARNEQGKQAMLDQKYAEATALFKQAVARVPEPRYLFNLCLSLYQEGKFGESLTACNAALNNAPAADLRAKIEKIIVRIKDEAKRQGVSVETK
jgi:hypothetical protein